MKDKTYISITILYIIVIINFIHFDDLKLLDVIILLLFFIHIVLRILRKRKGKNNET